MFPNYSPDALKTIRLPDLSDNILVDKLAACWERSRDMEVPQYRDGECEVRRLWDEAVAEAMGWDAAELQRLRHLLHEEPHVRGLGYEQYADEIEKQQEIAKNAEGSALPPTKAPKKTTSPRAASAASQVLRDGRTSKAPKSAAGSTLSQKNPEKR